MKRIWKSCIGICLVLAVMLGTVGCGNDDAAEEDNGQQNNSSGNLSGDLDDDVDDLEDDFDDAVDDLDGTADDYDDYEDAHEYLMNRLQSDHSDRKYEVRNRDAGVVEYQDGRNGYHYEIYDITDGDGGTKEGEFYVDRDNGKIYKKNETSNKIEEY